MDDGCEISLILPAYNEEAGIAQAVAEADEALQRLDIAYEIIVVDDGSTDQTARIVASETRASVRLVRHPVNRGYGAALRSGFETARGKLVAFTDADCQFDLADLGVLLPLTEHHAIAVGYRVDRQDTWLRKLASRGYNLLARTMLGISVRDIDCALKVFRREALVKILPESPGFFANTEMLTRAAQQHLTLAEASVRHRPRRAGISKVSIGEIPRTLRTLLPFWWTQVMFPGGASDVKPTGADGLPSPPGARGEQGRSYPNIHPHGMVACMLLLFAMTCVLFLARLDHPLLEPEEARYAEIPRQMLLRGDMLTPVLHGEAYWQKPPLLYWLVMASYQIFGVEDWSARLVPALAGIASVLITTLWAWRTLGFWTGLASGTILALSARFLYLAGMLSMDGLLCTWVLAGLAAGHLALTAVDRRVGWLILSALACALGVLTKGPVAVVLIATPLLALVLLDRRARWLSKGEWCGYASIVALVAGPWFAFMAARDAEAAGTFFWLHNLTRYLTPFDHAKPAWFYAPSLLLGMLPWTLLLVPLMPYLGRRSGRASRRRPAGLGLFVLAFAWCVLFFSLSGCKRPAYILPALPLLAVLLGTLVTHGLPWQQWMRTASRSNLWPSRLALTTLAMAFAISAAVGLSEIWTWSAAALACGIIATVGVMIVCRRTQGPVWRSWAGCVVIVFGFLAVGQRAWLPDYHARFGLRRQVEIASEYEQDEAMPIVTYPKRWDSISFYSRRADVESYAAANFAQLLHDINQHGKALVFVRREELRDLRRALPSHLELEVLGNENAFVAVALVRPRR